VPPVLRAPQLLGNSPQFRMKRSETGVRAIVATATRSTAFSETAYTIPHEPLEVERQTLRAVAGPCWLWRSTYTGRTDRTGAAPHRQLCGGERGASPRQTVRSECLPCVEVYQTTWAVCGLPSLRRSDHTSYPIRIQHSGCVFARLRHDRISQPRSCSITGMQSD
jgi:hypothetical protein